MSDLPTTAPTKPDPFKTVRSAADRYQRALALLEGDRSFEEGIQDAVSVEEAWRRLQAVLEALAAAGPHEHPSLRILIQTGEPRRKPWYISGDLTGQGETIPYRMIWMESGNFVTRDMFWHVHGEIKNPIWIGQWGTTTELLLREPWSVDREPEKSTRGQIVNRFRGSTRPPQIEDLDLADDPVALMRQLTEHAEDALVRVGYRMDQQAAVIERLRPGQRRAP